MNDRIQIQNDESQRLQNHSLMANRRRKLLHYWQINNTKRLFDELIERSTDAHAKSQMRYCQILQQGQI